MEIEQEFVFRIEEKKESYVFTINKKKYTLNIDETLDHVPDFFVLYFDLFENHESYKISNLYSQKKESGPKLVANISYDFFTKFEFYLVSLIRFSEENQKQKGKSNSFADIEKDKCSICLCDLYDNIDSLNIAGVLDNLFKTNQTDAIKLSNCEGHYFHLECLAPYCKDKQYIKCPVCSFIYGTMTGDGPDGKMDISVHNSIHCNGYENCGTITINYIMYAGKKNGVSYPSTHRTAYLPNNKEGNEVLGLLRKAFDRRLIFIVGDSVTTGAKNVIVWNGIHHKTSLFGGSSHFGYPDDTYFMRVKVELSDKGVV